MAAVINSIIEVDPKLVDNTDSDYASSGYDTSTASLTSSIQSYVFENGRRYHAYFGTDKNLNPTDEVEQDRLDIHHELFRVLMNDRLYEAPLKEPQRILDLGTGTGIWAIDMAYQFPGAEVIGTDLSPIQPKWVPPNCRFELDDMERDWTFQDNFFDFIHARNISQGITDWKILFQEIYRCTTPGGYVEFLEGGTVATCDDGTMSDTNPCKIFFDKLNVAMAKMGRKSLTSEDLKEKLSAAGFKDIQVSALKQPFGPWAKDKRLKQAGNIMLLNGETGFHAYGMAAFTRILGMSVEEADRLCSEGYRATLNKNHHMYIYAYRAYGRKPKPEKE